MTDNENANSKINHDALYLIVADENGQSDKALHYAMKAVKNARVGLAVLHVQSDENSIFMPWGGVSKTIADAKKQSAQEFLQEVRYKLEENNISPVLFQEEGSAIEVVENLIKKDPRIVKLILEADTRIGNLGPLVSYFSGTGLKDLSVPLTIIPSHLDLDIDGIL